VKNKIVEMKKNILLLLIVPLFFSAFSQEYNAEIKGSILNIRTFEPVNLVKIEAYVEEEFQYLDELNMPKHDIARRPIKTAFSNEIGGFLLDSLPKTKIAIYYTFEGFEVLRQEIDLALNPQADFMVLLKPLPREETDVFSLKGQLFDMQTLTPVSEASVEVFYPEQGAIGSAGTMNTAEDGGFAFQQLRHPLIVFTVKHPSYVTFVDTMNLNTALNNDIMVLLKKNDIQTLQLVTISENRIERTPYVSNITLSSELESMAISDVGEYLRSLPNVGGIRRGGANIDPVIRGFKFSQLNILINGAQGVEGGCPNRMDPATSRVEAEDLESLEVFKGPYALRYGAALGGTINLITKRPDVSETPEINVRAVRGYESNWNGHKEHISVQGANEHAFFLVSGSRWNYGNYKDGNGQFYKSAMNKHNYGALIGGSYMQHSFMFSARQSSHKVLFPALPMDETDDNSLLLFTEYSYMPEGDIFKSLSLKGYQANIHHIMDNKYRPFSDTVATVSDVIALTSGAKAEGVFSLFNGQLISGLEYQNRQKSGQRTKNMIMQPMLPVKVEDLWKDAVINNYGAYLEYTKAVKNFDFILAARYDYNTAYSDTIMLKNNMGNTILNIENTESQHHNISFSGGMTYHFNSKNALSLSLGRVSRSPDMLERFIILLPVGFDPYDYLGNPNLEPEVNNQLDLTFRNNNRWGGIELNAFYAIVENFIYGRLLPETVQKPFTIGVLGVKQFYNADDVHIKGFEAAYKTPEEHKLHFQFSAAYAHAHITTVTKYIRANNQIVDEEVLTNDPLNEIPPFEGNLRISYDFFSKRLTPFAGLRLVAAQNNVSEAMYESKTPAFSLINAGFAYKHHKYLNLYAGVNNILNKAYYEHLNRRIVGSTTNIFEPGRVFYVNLIFNL